MVRPAENIDELISSAKQIGLAQINWPSIRSATKAAHGGMRALRFRDAGITVKSGMFGTVGEDYATIAQIHETGGVLPDDLAGEFDNLHIAASFATTLGIEQIAMSARSCQRRERSDL